MNHKIYKDKININMHGDYAIDHGKLIAGFKKSNRYGNSKLVVFDQLFDFDKGWQKHYVYKNMNFSKPTNNDLSFYRHKKLTLPRDKFALLKDKYNWSITRDSDKADYHVISNKLLASTISWSYTSEFICYDDLKKMIDRIEEENLLTQNSFNKLKSTLSYGEDYLYSFSFGTYWIGNNAQSVNVKKIANRLDDIYKIYSKQQTFLANDGRVYYKKNTCDLIEEASFNEFVKGTASYVLDEYLVGLCNEDSPVLDETQFETIESLITSNDKADIAMGLNVLANCNIEKSRDIVSYFYVFYYNSMKEGANWNSVIVKSMRKYFSPLDRFAGGRSQNSYMYDQYIQYLIKSNSLSEFIYKKIVKIVFQNVVSPFFWKDTVFKKIELQLKDEWKDQLKPAYKEDLCEITLDAKDDLPF